MSRPGGPTADIAAGWRILDVFIAARQRIGGLSGRFGGVVLLLPAVCLVTILAAGILLLAWRSFHVFDPFLFKQGDLSTANYRQVFETPLMREVFLRTVMMALVTTTIAVTVALPTAYVMTRLRSRALRVLILVAIFIPILTGDIARAYGWLVLLGREGLLAWVTEHIGLGTPQLLGTLWAVGIGTVQILIPLSVVILLPAFQRVDSQFEQAAATLGAGPVRVWTRVILPLVRPGIAGAAAVCITVSMTEFANPGLLGQGVRDYVANLVQNVVLGRDNVYLGSAIGLSLLVVVMVLVTTVLVAGQRGRGSMASAGPGGGGATRISPALCAMTASTLLYLTLPTLIIIASSFSAGAQIAFPPRGFTIDWYGDMLRSGTVWDTLLNSLYVGLVSVVVTVVVAVPAMLAVHRRRVRGGTYVTAYLSIGLATPFIVSAIAFLIVFTELGVLRHLTAVAIAIAIVNLPFMLWAVASSILDHGTDLEKAAATLGAEEVQQFLFVTVPAVAPGVITGGLMVFVLGITEFVVSAILVNLNNLTLPVFVYSGIRTTVSPFLAAVAVLFIAVAACVLSLVIRFGRIEQFLYRR
jgi:ABC-type spermidine/putrescine transport system permease subunit II